MSDTLKYPRAVALRAARELVATLLPHCELDVDGKPFLKVCGSLRRGKTEVGDVELVYIPRVDQVPDPADLLGSPGTTHPVNQVDAILDEWIRTGRLEKRLNKLGRLTWGPENKLARHTGSGVPVDLFATDRRAWWSYVVCRTGSARTNTQIAAEALRKGWHWHPTQGFFTDVMGRRQWITSEQDVFSMVGLPYREPAAR